MPEAWAPPEADTEKPWQPPEASDFSPPESVDSPKFNPRNEQIRSATPFETSRDQVTRLSDLLFEPGEKTQHPIISSEVADSGTHLAAAPARMASSLLGSVTGKPYTRIERGVEQAISGAASGFSLENLAQLPMFAVPGVAEAYAARVANILPEQYGGVKEAIGKHGLFSTETGKAIADAGIQDVTALLGIKGAPKARAAFREGLTDTLFPKPKEEVIPNAIEERPIPESGIVEHPVTQEGRPAAETSSSDRTAQSREIPQEILGSKIEGPALIDADGKVIAQGKVGETHADLLKSVMGTANEDSAITAFANDASHVFTDDKGNVLNRDQATSVAKSAGQVEPTVDRLQSEDLKSPKLLPGETQGDLISSTQPEDLKLVGEKGTDYSALTAEADRRAQATEEARLKAEHEQGLLSDFQEHQKAGGDELLSALRDAGGLPAVYASDHPLSGELNTLREEFEKSSKHTQQKFAKAGEVNFGDVFSAKGRQDIDQLTRDLNAKGFDVQTPNDLISLVQDRLRSGKPIYSSEARGAALEQGSFGAVGIVPHPLPGFIKGITDYFTENTPSQIWNTIKGSLDASLGKTFAKTTIADRTAGEAGARWISAKIAAPHLADTFTTNVLEGSGIDPVKFGAALTEDNLRSIKAAAETPEAKAAVNTIIGAKGSPFKTEAEYKAFLSDPATQQAIARHKELWEQSVDPMYRKAQLLDPSEPLASRGEETGARINLYNDTEGTGKDVVSGTGKGNLTATFRRKSPFAVQAKGTGQSYNINYDQMMANTFGRQLEIAAKNDFETKLVDSGNAIIGKPGENPILPDGEKTVSFPLKRSVIITAEDGSKIPVNKNIYIRKSLATEYRNAANVDRYDVPAVVKAFANAANKSALAGLTDASVHGLNLMTALFTRPSIIGGALSDSLLSTFGRADVPFTIVKVLKKAFSDNKSQIASLSEIGAMKAYHPTRNPLANFIKVADRSTRLVLDDTFQKMADAGLVENTETNRREFVNQVGQYNLKAQGGLRRMAREVGFGPFATAGTTFNTLGLRMATLSPGVKATSPLAAASLRANVLSKWVGATVLVGTLNYLLTKDKGGGVSGRPGVPIGSVDSGLNDQNGRPLSFSVFNLLGLGRALRVTGARGLIESQRKGLNLSTALDASARDVANSAISPFAGPVIRFGTVATTGFQPAINVPRTGHVAPPGQNQFEQNVKDAILDANPVVKSFALSREPGGNASDAIRQQIPRLSLTPTQRPEFIEKYPEIVAKAQASAFVDDVVRRARNMRPEARTKFVNESLDKLSDQDRSHAVKTLKYRKIDY